MAKQNKSKKKKRPAPQAPAAKPAQTAPAPEQPPRTAKLMAALCYLNAVSYTHLTLPTKRIV